MANIKCAKCGAEMPENATFCPACGAPKEEKKETPKKESAAAPKSEPNISRSPQEMINSFFTEKNMFIMIPLGVLIACIGGLVYLFSGSITGLRAGLIINIFGCLLIGMFLLMCGITIKSYDKFVRLGMIVGGVILLTWTLSIPA